MRRIASTRVGRTYARVLLAALVVGLGTPLLTPASPAAAIDLGGYTGSAESSAVRVAIYEPAVPIPASPQVDASIGYARSTTSTGPTSRGLASYVWPGDAVGDGLGTLAGNEAFDYPVKVSSKYPASDSAPATNAAQLTDGNGMSTSANETTTRANVTGLGLGSNITKGLGKGLCVLLKQKCPDKDFGFELPGPLATAASMENVRSSSVVELGDKTVTSTARSTVTGLSLLAGVIQIDAIDMTTTVTTDGVKAVTSGRAKVVGLTVAGKKVDLGDPISIDGKDTPAPNVPIDLSMLGIKIQYLTKTASSEGASGSIGVQGLTVTVDVGVLGKILGNGALSDALAPLIGDIPQAGPLLVGLLKLGTKIVITVGDVRTSATGSPAYVGPPLGPSGPESPVPNGPTLPENPGVAPPIGDLPIGDTPPPSLTPTPGDGTPVAFEFPGLGKTPSVLILALLAAAGLLGWLFRTAGAFLLGGDDCALGLSVGVPNLREG